jgi:hypothetical protein
VVDIRLHRVTPSRSFKPRSRVCAFLARQRSGRKDFLVVEQDQLPSVDGHGKVRPTIGIRRGDLNFDAVLMVSPPHRLLEFTNASRLGHSKQCSRAECLQNLTTRGKPAKDSEAVEACGGSGNRNPYHSGGVDNSIVLHHDVEDQRRLGVFLFKSLEPADPRGSPPTILFSPAKINLIAHVQESAGRTHSYALA